MKAFIATLCLCTILLGISGVAHAETNDTAQSTASRSIPTTSNPTGSGIKAARIISNPSFEQSDFAPAWSVWATISEDSMRGWYTSHPLREEWYDSIQAGTSLHRLIELQKNNPAHGTYMAELNAWDKSMVFQPICFVSGESFDFSFYHSTQPAGRTDTVDFRIGIPLGLPAGSLPVDSYSRSILVANTTTNGGRIAVATDHNSGSFPIPADTTSVNSNVERGWGKYEGTHTLPASGWTGIFHVGFNSIITASDFTGNLLDNITIGLQPIIDLGTSRDTSSGESGIPTALNIRISGRVAGGTTLMLQMSSGTAIPDTDFALGSVNAGGLGTGSITHVPGSNNWLITVPPGDYDGGVVPANNIDGLTIPITYTNDTTIESDEYAFFTILAPSTLGSSNNWILGDPVCDSSSKVDGVVYTIVDTSPTLTPTSTFTPSHTPTETLTPTETVTPTAVPTRTRIPTNTATATMTETSTVEPPTATTLISDTATLIASATSSANTSIPTLSVTTSRTPLPTATITPTHTITKTRTRTIIASPTASMTMTVTPVPVVASTMRRDDALPISVLLDALATQTVPIQQIVQSVAQFTNSNSIDTTQIIALTSHTQVMNVIAPEDARRLFAALDESALTEAEILALTNAIQHAPTPVRHAFEQEINLFASGFNAYIPLGSEVPIGTRRALVVLTLVSTFMARSNKRRRR